MGAPKTQTVGGGSATPVANSWNQFLQGQLYQQPGAQSVPQTAAGGSQPPNVPGWIPSGIRDQIQQQYQAQNPAQQQGPPGQFQNILNSFMNPNYGNMIAQNPFLAGAQGYNPMAQMPQAPNLPSATGGYTPANAATMDPMSFIGGFGGGPDLLKQYGINLNQLLTPGAGGGNYSFTPGTLKDASTDPSFQAIQQIAERQKMNDVANLRARYGMGGNTQSSGASLAESQYLAEANPRLVAGLGDLTRQTQGLDLELQKINNAGMLGAANANRGLGGGDISQNLGNILQFIQGTRGQDIGAASGLAGQNLSNQQSANNLNANNLLQALGIDSSNMLNLFGQQSSNALNNQQLGNNWMQTLFGGGLNLAGLGQQGQMSMMQNLFNSFNQSNQLGTPQAQTVQTPSAFGQLMGLAGAALPFIPGLQPAAMGAQLAGMGRPTMAAPQVQGLSPQFVPNFGIGQQPQINYWRNG